MFVGNLSFICIIQNACQPIRQFSKRAGSWWHWRHWWLRWLGCRCIWHAAKIKCHGRSIWNVCGRHGRHATRLLHKGCRLLRWQNASSASLLLRYLRLLHRRHRSDWSRWNRGILNLLEHKFNLGNFVTPTTTAQEAEQGIIDGQRLVLLTHESM